MCKSVSNAFHLIHHLIRVGVLEYPLMIWLVLVPQTEDAPSGFAIASFLFCPSLAKTRPLLLFDVILRLTPLGFLSMAECGFGFNQALPALVAGRHRRDGDLMIRTEGMKIPLPHILMKQAGCRRCLGSHSGYDITRFSSAAC